MNIEEITDKDAILLYSEKLNEILADISDLRLSACTHFNNGPALAVYESKMARFVEKHLSFLEEVILESGSALAMELADIEKMEKRHTN